MLIFSYSVRNSKKNRFRLQAEARAGAPPRAVTLIPGQGIHSDPGNEGILRALLLQKVSDLGGFAMIDDCNQGRIQVSAGSNTSNCDVGGGQRFYPGHVSRGEVESGAIPA